MIFTLFDSETVGVVLMLELTRWFVGVSYENPETNIHAIVVRLGPLSIHTISRR